MNLRLAQAAAALDAGRLAEAAALLERAGSHRQGFELRGRLLATLLDRGGAYVAVGGPHLPLYLPRLSSCSSHRLNQGHPVRSAGSPAASAAMLPQATLS